MPKLVFEAESCARDDVRQRLCLVGEANPYGSDSYYALYPAPEGCSGHRLCCKVFGMHPSTYLQLFDRVNLCPHRWSDEEARAHAARLKSSGSRCVLLGARVTGAFGLEYRPFTVQSCSALILPHPSGLSRAWSASNAVSRARRAVIDFAPHLAEYIGASDA